MSFQGFGGGGGGGFQSGGGGFMSPGLDSSGTDSQKNKKNRSQTLLPITAAMLNKADYDPGEDSFSFEGVDIHQVTFVGIIREVQETATNISYKVDDMTGEFILVKKWIDVDDPMEQNSRSECREDTYVRIVGNIKSLNNGQVRSVMAFCMTPIKDFDEISFHFLDVVYANLNLKKVSSNATQNSPQRYNNMSNMNINDNFGGVNDAGLTGANKVIFNHISSCTTEQGISIDTLKMKNRNMSENQLRGCIEWLSNEGHIYSTVDDDHYRSTSS